MKNPNPWSRLNRLLEYCNDCKNKDSCAEWCFGDNYERSSAEIIKDSILSRFLRWIRGIKSEDSR